MVDKLGTHGEGPDIDKVLNGTFVYPTDCNADTKAFLEECTYATNVGSVKEDNDIRTRFQQHISSWQSRRESTCTNGQHVGHY